MEMSACLAVATHPLSNVIHRHLPEALDLFDQTSTKALCKRLMQTLVLLPRVLTMLRATDMTRVSRYKVSKYVSHIGRVSAKI